MIKANTLVFFLAASLLALVHFLSIELYLYWRYLWIDMPIHFLGGVTVALGHLSVRDFIPSWPTRWFHFWPVILFVLAIAVAWEIFEAIIGISLGQPDFVFDTATDLLCGLGGGLVGYFIGSRLSELNYHE